MSTKGKSPLGSLSQVFRAIIWPRRWKLLLGLFLILVNRLCGLALPISTKYFIDDVVGKGDTDFLTTLLLLVGGAVFVQAISSFTLTRMLSVEAQYLVAQLRARVQRHIIHLPISYFDNMKTGVLVSRIMGDVEGVRNLVGTGLVQLVGGFVTAIVAFVLLVNIDGHMTLIALVPLVLFGTVSFAAFSYIRPIFRERGAINAEVTGRLTEALGGIRVIKGFNAEEREEKVFEEGVGRIFASVKKSLTGTSFVTSTATLLLGAASVTIMGFGGHLIIEGELTVGEFFQFTLLLGFLVTPVLQMANIGTQITEAFAGLDRTGEILSLPREGEAEGRTEILGELRGDIIFDGVAFAYAQGPDVLKDINFQAQPGTVTAFVGSSGAGKTTLAGLAASFLEPTRGTVHVDGHDLARVQLGSYRRQLGLVLQDDFLFEGSIRENVLFGTPDATESELRNAIESAHVKEFTDRFENGLETIIGERGIKLSGGQRQRVAIARALLANPRVLVLDEATSNLDTESEAYIQESLRILMQGRTTFVIAHRLSTIQRADQILVMEDGRIVERGTHQELLDKVGRYHRLHTYQARI